MYSEDAFTEFERSLTLTEKERNAVAAWLGLRYEDIRSYQRTGEGSQEIVGLESHLSNALAKALVCRKTVFRGLSAGNCRPERMAYLNKLLHDQEVIQLPCHDSATVSEEIGRAFTFTGTDVNDHLYGAIRGSV